MRSAGKILWSFLGIAIMASTLAGCQKEKAPTSSVSSATNADKPTTYKIAVIPKATAHSFWLTVKAGADSAGREEGAEIIWQGPSQETQIAEQINIFQNQLNAGVNGIVLAACDAHALIRPVKEALERGVPVVTIDSGLAKEEDPSLCYIATDNVEGGRRAAEALAKAIGGKGTVGMLPYIKGAVSSDEREKGFREGISKYPNIQLVSVLYTESDPEKAINQTQNMLTAHPDIAGIFAANEPAGVGAASVLKQKGLAGKVKLVAYDASAEERKALEEGVIQALIVQDPFQMGYKGVKTVLKAIRKEPITEKFIDSGVTVVTKENLHTPAVQKLLNPLP